MRFKLTDVKPQKYPDRIVGRRSERGFNTSTVNVRAKCGKGVLDPEINKSSVDTRRIQREAKRTSECQMHDDIRQRFGPRLVRKDGSALYQFQCK